MFHLRFTILLNTNRWNVENVREPIQLDLNDGFLDGYSRKNLGPMQTNDLIKLLLNMRVLIGVRFRLTLCLSVNLIEFISSKKICVYFDEYEFEQRYKL